MDNSGDNEIVNIDGIKLLHNSWIRRKKEWHTSFSHSTAHAFRCHQGPEIRSAFHAILAKGLQRAKNTVGSRRTFLKYKATIIWNSY